MEDCGSSQNLGLEKWLSAQHSMGYSVGVWKIRKSTDRNLDGGLAFEVSKPSKNFIGVIDVII